MRFHTPEPTDTDLARMAAQKAASERRMSIIDEAPPEWRALINEYPMTIVASFYEDGRSVKTASEQLVYLFGRPLTRQARRRVY